ncbi:hydrogenase maturation nickel metallochaperone HypA [Candidatus Woesearchaeota archaeon]|jgi:hydrogenase nickel insertion protein HypA|nr:hydrogenase maturation nickel metallochaperone HypA [Candidatus Woesearchaeota archaeon]MBT5272793.1 hydrogenase maturation nickel metallochaperone HypA [Candidatus Woesearchaeota archaeon]MBT6040405.1 hydrogenase maturation nickel metallochaperone HypA [Candidatus Woesearchaeota archaeon]MBT6336962.1 hydrogenase maturation nickel metallochaperone HypA [Candidatus Woesearchaeota archaeon]MBT7926848.1 hydrogenase maturation nickel metallochaperone HypA [Candidatus Woesearchaeota archaeon]
MHEYGVTQSLVSQILVESEKNNVKPKIITVELGNLTTYKAESIKFYFDMLKKEHDLLKSAKLELNEVKGKLLCNQCKKEHEVQESHLIFCPKCEGHDIEIVAGKDFIIKNIQGD